MQGRMNIIEAVVTSKMRWCLAGRLSYMSMDNAAQPGAYAAARQSSVDVHSNKRAR